MARMGFITMALVVMRLLTAAYALNENAVNKLAAAETTVKATVDALKTEWKVDMFPNFLKSCFMHKVSWEIMKLKYQKKILSSLSATGGRTKFVISFTGR